MDEEDNEKKGQSLAQHVSSSSSLAPPKAPSRARNLPRELHSTKSFTRSRIQGKKQLGLAIAAAIVVTGAFILVSVGVVTFSESYYEVSLIFANLTVPSNIDEFFALGCSGMTLTLALWAFFGWWMFLGLMILIYRVFALSDNRSDSCCTTKITCCVCCNACCETCCHCSSKECDERNNQFVYFSSLVTTICTFPFIIFLIIASAYVIVPGALDPDSPQGCKRSSNSSTVAWLSTNGTYGVPGEIIVGYYSLTICWVMIGLLTLTGFVKTLYERRDEAIHCLNLGRYGAESGTSAFYSSFCNIYCCCFGTRKEEDADDIVIRLPVVKREKRVSTTARDSKNIETPLQELSSQKQRVNEDNKQQQQLDIQNQNDGLKRNREEKTHEKPIEELAIV